jgi:hypothetical protein
MRNTHDEHKRRQNMTMAASDIKTTGRGHAFVFIAAAISALYIGTARGKEYTGPRPMGHG